MADIRMTGENYTQYTLNGETYFVRDTNMFALSGEWHDIDDIETASDTQLYLYNEKLVRIELGPMSVRLISPEYSDYFDPISYDDFDGAEPVTRLVPDHLVTCPNCGSAAGRQDEPEHQSCIECGWTSDECVYDYDSDPNESVMD